VNKPNKKLTSFKLDAVLMRRARHYALDHETTVTAMIEHALRDLLAKSPKENR